MNSPRWHPVASSEDLIRAVCAAVADASAKAIAECGRFTIVLAGGATPRDVYRQLPRLATDWSKWHVYYGDERCLPPDHADRNSRMAELAWLRHVAIPPQQIHAIPAELGPERGAEEYSRTLHSVGDFDLVLLGLGEDGHTASLFPGNVEELHGAAAIPVLNAPKPPAERVSLSVSRLSATHGMIFMVSGAGKLTAVEQWLHGGTLPAAALRPECGIEVWLDQAAGGRLVVPIRQGMA